MIKGLVSIIIPVYNREDLITDTIYSILNQNYSNIECIIIDDGSTDNTFNLITNIANNDKRLKCFSRPRYLKKGANVCRNFGYSISKGEFIIWFDSDDIMTDNSILSRVLVINDTGFNFIIGRIRNFYNSPLENIDLKKSIIAPITNNPASEYFLGKFWFHTSASLFTRKYLERFNKHFDKDISFHDEGEFFIRLLLSSPNIFYTEDVVTLRRMHNISVSYVYNSDIESEKLYKDHFGSLKIWLSFVKHKQYYNDEIHLFYKYYFSRWIFKMKLNSFRLLWVLYLGLKYNMFDDNLEISKIVIWRIFKSK